MMAKLQRGNELSDPREVRSLLKEANSYESVATVADQAKKLHAHLDTLHSAAKEKLQTASSTEDVTEVIRILGDVDPFKDEMELALTWIRTRCYGTSRTSQSQAIAAAYAQSIARCTVAVCTQ